VIYNFLFIYSFSHDLYLHKNIIVGCQGRLKDGKIAAIKVLSADSKQGVREFLTEINVISEIEHENLVKLYGCCVEENHRILVYNYLENNSLAQTLIGKFLISLSLKSLLLTSIILLNLCSVPLRICCHRNSFMGRVSGIHTC
jgi:serine/threonine protein kinase